MVKRRVRKPVKKAPTSPEADFDAEETRIDDIEAALLLEEESYLLASMSEESYLLFKILLSSAAIRAIRDVEIENSLTGLLRSS
ncbi:hypothetical protein EZV62_015152 [Acer yangbiense]|uniref:Uncharacterized protein n=1 Tax=Acer yangbiense TaxID=1000413 RepID=A0A5C7HUW4_9ROSI|nr:hypothetical protein EZV62_015152 [Acer yangbiense]